MAKANGGSITDKMVADKRALDNARGRLRVLDAKRAQTAQEVRSCEKSYSASRAAVIQEFGEI